MGQDIGNLVRGHCIQPAAKGIELNQIQIILGLYKACLLYTSENERNLCGRHRFFY